MLFTEIIFALSLVGIVFILCFKLVEDYFGTFHWWARFAEAADKKVHAISTSILKKYRLYKKIAYLFLFEFLPAYIYRKTVEFKDYTYRKYYESQSNLKGSKKMLRSNGSVSEFLQNITKEERAIEKIHHLEEELDS